MIKNKKCASNTSAIEVLENRMHLSATPHAHHPVTARGVVLHEVAKIGTNPDPLAAEFSTIQDSFAGIKLPLETGILTGTIHWGDGSVTSGLGVGNSNGSYLVDLTSHIYSRPGNFKITVDLAESDSGTIVGVINNRAVVARDLTAGRTIRTTAGATFNKLIGIYSPFNTSGDSTSNFTIDWGDQTGDTAAKIVVHGKVARIYGSHQYSTAGVYQVQVIYKQPTLSTYPIFPTVTLPFSSTVIVKG